MMKVLTSLPTSKPTKLAGISPKKKKSRRPTRAGFSSSSEWWQPWELVEVLLWKKLKKRRISEANLGFNMIQPPTPFLTNLPLPQQQWCHQKSGGKRLAFSCHTSRHGNTELQADLCEWNDSIVESND